MKLSCVSPSSARAAAALASSASPAMYSVVFLVIIISPRHPFSPPLTGDRTASRNYPADVSINGQGFMKKVSR